MFADLGCFGVELIVSESKGIRRCGEKIFQSFSSNRINESILVELIEVDDFRDSEAQWFWDAFAKFLEKRPFFTHRLSKLKVHTAESNAFLLVFENAAVVHVSAQTGSAHGIVLESALQNGRFEDILYTSLAPILRRREVYLVHAFCAEKKACPERGRRGKCVLLVGPPHSGKTTAGLALLQAGWQLLSNDVTLLSQSDDQIMAWPTPGYFGVRENTLALFPDLDIATGMLTTQQVLQGINGRFGSPSPITHLIFPEVNADEPTKLFTLSTAEGWSRLMSESMDCWDKETLGKHLTVLKQVCGKTAVFSLQSGFDIHQFDQLLIEER